MSNVQRQRRFRARHPGYFQRYHARQKAAIAALQAAPAEPAAAEPLMLPAPVEMPLFPGLSAIPTTPARAPQPVPIPQPATMPAHQSIAT
jgi:hypothetical protein